MCSLKSVALFAGLASAVGVSKRQQPIKQYPDYGLLAKCPGYTASNVVTSDTGLKADITLAGKACNAYGDDLKDLILEVTYETDQRIHIKIQDKENQVYQVPESVFPRSDSISSPDSSALKFNYVEKPFSFKVSRKDTDEVIFDTSAASLIFESQYLRLRTKLPANPYLYGLGEHSDPLRLPTKNYIRTLWNQDSYGIPNRANLYGAQPLYLEHRESGSHGVLFLNSNGMDIMINNNPDEGQYLEYNAIGGVLDFYVFAGPSPVEVTQQYADLAGLPAFQPYWGLGFHQCRYGYQDAFAVAEAVYNYSQAGIPLETMWTDIDYMDRRLTFTTDPDRYPREKLRSLVKHLHDHDQQYIVMVNPAAGYQNNYATLSRGLEDNVWLLRDNGSVWLGVVWPGVTVFPDWFAQNTSAFWNREFEIMFNPNDGIDIDALWIDMNEPSAFPCFFPCADPYKSAIGFPPKAPPVRENPRALPGFPCEFQPADKGGCDTSISTRSEITPISQDTYTPNDLVVRQSGAGDQSGLPGRDLLYPKYAIHNKAAWRDDWNADKGGISNKTVLTNVIHQNGLAMYDTHNLFGALMSTYSYDAMLKRRPNKRPLIITRSTFSGTGKKVGHWLGDNLSNWDHYRASIRTMLVYTSLFQFPMTGSDTCGFGGNAAEDLCARWASLGAFNIFYRNHNSFESSPQEFYRWKSVTESARKAIDIRYRLMDYMYTSMAAASRDGSPVQYPMFYIYPKDKTTWDLDLQFFYGPGVLVAPVTQQGATSVDVYLPKDLFYDWYTHEPLCGTGGKHTFSNVDTTHIPLLIRSGVIIPLREYSANTTTALRAQNFEILIPLNEKGEAKGELYFDDGESIDPASNGGVSRIQMTFRNGKLALDGDFGYEVPVVISRVTVLNGKGCKAQEVRGANGKFSRSKEVELSLNEAGSIRIET